MRAEEAGRGEGTEGLVASVRGLSKSYAFGESQIRVLSDVSLEVRAPELTAVMGPSGAGKTTLLHCVAGLDRPDRGEIRVLGTDLAALDEDRRTVTRRRHIGIIYQFFNLVSNLDVEENVMLPYLIDGVDADHDAVLGALARVGMRHRERHLPSQLSGGEMQLVSIARAIVRRPRLILADEPTGNVNVATGRRIMGLLREVITEAKSALLLVTHNPEDAARADRVVFLKDGTIAPEATLAGGDVSVARIHERLRDLGI